MSTTQTITRLRARQAALARFGRMADAQLCRRDLAVAVLEDRIADLLTQHHPTPEQRQRLVGLLAAVDDSARAPEMGTGTHAPERNEGRDLSSPGLATAPR